MVKDPKTRFSDRVEDYARYRPGYPDEILAFLGGKCALTDDSVVADVGSGTGNLSVLFLEHGNKVFAVEPNEEMQPPLKDVSATIPASRALKGRRRLRRSRMVAWTSS